MPPLTCRFVADGRGVAPAARQVDAGRGVGHHDLVHARQTRARTRARSRWEGACVREVGVQAALHVAADQPQRRRFQLIAKGGVGEWARGGERVDERV